jgi:hypothetical protein
LDTHWAVWFADLTLAYEGDTTVLRGSLADEAALHGVPTKIAGLNLHLVSVYVVEGGGTNSDPPTAIARDQAPLEAPPSESAADTAPSKRTPRPPRRFRHKRPSP